MPFADTERPALGISLLKARLTQEGVACDLLYLNLAFARLLGRQAYQRVANELPFKSLAGEWVFVDSLYGAPTASSPLYIDDILRARFRCSEDDVDAVLRARALAPRFLADQLRGFPWGSFDIVGFSSMCAQNLGSLALARMVKEEHPGVVVVFGGANWQGSMGRRLHRVFPFVDFVCVGEGDTSFPRLVRHVGHRHLAPPDSIPGIVYRDHQCSMPSGTARPVEDLDSLPLPDFEDFMAQYAASGSVTTTLPVMLAETSRGCWWAADHPCSFCGLNGTARKFRTKRPKRILSELRELAGRWPAGMLELVDNVVSPAFFSHVLPELVDRRLPVPLFLEVRPDLDHEDVRRLAAARASIQPGIESLSDHVLDLMGKGTRVLENLRLLRWCKEEGVKAYWNVIHGFPGESEEDYANTLGTLPFLRFLDPPVSFAPLNLTRFSAYYERPRHYGFRNVRPLAAYSYVYPFSERVLRDIAFSFDYDYAPGSEPPKVDAFRHEIEAWQRARNERLMRVDTGNGLLLIDTRAQAVSPELALDPLEHVLYDACGDPRDRDDLMALATALEVGHADSEEQVGRRLRMLVERGLMVSAERRFLSLAVKTRAAR
jgi:ribosomal peptide maturation radical SAM protein 1